VDNIKEGFMQSSKRTIAPLMYFILISSFTNLTFLLVGIVLLLIFSVKLLDPVLQIIVFLLLWKGGLVGIFSWFFHKKANNKDFLVKFIGIYLGRFFGIFIGGFLGIKMFDVINQSTLIGLIVGALAFYFVGRWTGSKVSILIGKQLDNVFHLPETAKIADTISANRSISIGFILYGVILPFLLVVIGLLMNYFDIPTDYLTELLPISRIVVVVFSIISICYPWLMKNRWRNIHQKMSSSPNTMVYWLGLVFSSVPVIYGFLLFIVMGAPIVELCIYAVVSFISVILWSMNHGVLVRQNAG